MKGGLGFLLVLAFLVPLAVAAGVSAQSGVGYDLTWNTIDGGGDTFSAGVPYSLGGTVGQADAGLLSGGGYTLAGGFWGSGQTYIFLPMILRATYY